MASNQLNTIHSHSKPDEVSNQSLPEHEDVMDHESSPEKDDDPAAQAPALPVMPGPSVNKKVPKVSSSEDYSCGINCGGKFLGEHQCIYSTNKPLTIQCVSTAWRGGFTAPACNSKFKTRNNFNRHFKSTHLLHDTRIENMIPCPFKGCKKTGHWGFIRYDNLLQHRRSIHKENIPKTHVTPRMKAPKPYARKTVNPNDAGPSNASN
ncbi:uncharacterized protein H6S33_009461 [Morchella sextelata]|uniref:uncharacterized protein n=1 Tax=Morchella sextelata TaxID=1174677 RepID=UPI001D03837D|nr:uncharacterized protein H6S33_009461 [Morchella sextelata]KAH0613081.1 hypothetical protein H6S33_009461 [Morchella sextelata]